MREAKLTGGNGKAACCGAAAACLVGWEVGDGEAQGGGDLQRSSSSDGSRRQATMCAEATL
jgi:hypothetical protein